MYVYLGANKIRLDPAKSIGKGGEADVFLVGNDLALKVFKQPNHPDYKGFLQEQQGARERLAEHQKKLKVFPRNLPNRVIVPQELATDINGQTILGYTMKFVRGAEPLFRYSERPFREAGIPNERMVEIFRDIHKSVAGIHQAQVVIGDFNDLNVLVLDADAYLIDADSFQFGPFLCRMFTAKFMDPLLTDPKNPSFTLSKPYSTSSDWYAFNVMLMQCLLFVDPYGGIYIPKNKNNKIPQGKRPLHRITVFHSEVRYPKPAIPYDVLPDDLLQHFHQVFEKDAREEFPYSVLEEIRWTHCINCGLVHARGSCPVCSQAAPAAVKAVTTIRGEVIASRIFRTDGIILFAAPQEEKLNWLFYESGQFKREDGSIVMGGRLDPQIRFRIKGKSTLLGRNNQLVTLTPNQRAERMAVDSYGNLPVFDTNERHRYWLSSGQLLRDGTLGSEYIGDVLIGQTLFWVGPKFGFGFYRAGNLSVAFTFDAEHRGINDRVKFPSIRGQLIDSTCVFSKERCWFFLSSQEGAEIINQCLIVKPDGTIEATAKAKRGDGSWLSTIRGKCAVGNFLLAATDQGIVRFEPDRGQIIQTKEFPDTEPFVDTNCHLFPGKEVLYVVGRQEIITLKIR